MMITHYALHYKNRVLQIFLVIALALFCFAFAKNIKTITDNITPLSSGNVEAMFYIENKETGSLTCIGDGLISTNLTIYNAEEVKNYILTAPDYSNHLPADYTIIWNSIKPFNNSVAVFGAIAPKSNYNSIIRDYHQQDNYGFRVKQAINNISPIDTYYFSSSGDDKNDGLTPEHPKKNPHNYIKNGNCKCLLKSGDIFHCDSTVFTGNNLILSTYGGEKRAAFDFTRNSISEPILVDSKNLIYKASLDTDIDDIGWLNINGSKSWKRVLSNELMFPNEYYVDKTNKCVYFKSASILTTQSLEYSNACIGIRVPGKENVLIENIEISNAAIHGIQISTSSNIIIYNCNIHDIGGTYSEAKSAKYGNGVEIWADRCHNIYIYKNIISDCYDSGMTAQIDFNQHDDSDQLIFANNVVERCIFGFECFQKNPNYKIQNIVVDNNIFYDMFDITNDYRYSRLTKFFTGYLSLWRYENPDCSLIISNNFGFKTQTEAILFSENFNITPPIEYSDNLLITTNRAIRNSASYTGDEKQYEVIKQNSIEYDLYNEKINQIISNYNTYELCH